MNYILVITMFLLYVLYTLWIDRSTKEENEKRELVKKDLLPIVNEEENKYNLKSKPILNLRIMSLFTAISDPDEKEKLRERLIEIPERIKVKPARYLVLVFSKVFLFVAIIYSVIFLFPEPPNPFLSYATIAVVMLNMFFNKKYGWMIILGAFGFIFYQKIAGTVMLLILLNSLWNLLKTIRRKRGGASKELI